MNAQTFILDYRAAAPGDAFIVRYNLNFLRGAANIQIGTITQDGKTIDVAGSMGEELTWANIFGKRTAAPAPAPIVDEDAEEDEDEAPAPAPTRAQLEEGDRRAMIASEERAARDLRNWNEWAIRTGYKRPDEVSYEIARYTRPAMLILDAKLDPLFFRSLVLKSSMAMMTYANQIQIGKITVNGKAV